MTDLKGKVALVAGGAGYLGTPVCRKLAERGAAVAIADIKEDSARRLAEEIRASVPDSEACSVPLDIDDELSIRSCVAKAVEEFGRLDVLVNATFRSIGRDIDDLSAEEFSSALHTNVIGAFLLSREAAGAMANGGSIIMFSSMYGMIAPDPSIYPAPMKPNPIEYGTSKAAVMQMVRYLAVFWAQKNIRVNGVIPGAFTQPWVVEANPDFLPMQHLKIPMGRVGRREEITGAVAFLASEDASYITGQGIVVDGGWTIW